MLCVCVCVCVCVCARALGMLKQQQEDYQGKIEGLRGDLIGDMEALRAEVKVRECP